MLILNKQTVILISYIPIVTGRPYSQQTRDKASIENSGAYDRPQFHPSPLTKFG